MLKRAALHDLKLGFSRHFCLVQGFQLHIWESCILLDPSQLILSMSVSDLLLGIPNPPKLKTIPSIEPFDLAHNTLQKLVFFSMKCGNGGLDFRSLRYHHITINDAHCFIMWPTK